MSDDITKLQRWLDLVAYLVGRRLPVPVSELMERIPAYAEKWRGGDDTSRATARRTFERDKRELRETGIPIETVSYTVNFGGERKEGYRLEEDDFYLPYLRIVSGAAGAGGPGVEGADPGEGPRRGSGSGTSAGRPGADVPVVEIDAAEAAVAVDALRRAGDLPAFPLAAEARSALRKLTFDLDADWLPHTPVFHPDRPGAAETARRVSLLADALLERRRVRFRYRGIRRGRVTDRDVAPYGLFYQHGEWYLVGSDAARDGDTRVFRADRMEEVEPGGGSGGFEIPDGFEVADFLGREAWELGGETGGEGDAGYGGEAGAGTVEDEVVDARVLFRFPASLRVERHGRGEAVEEWDDGAAVRRFRVRQVGPFLRWLLTFRGDAEVLAPASLRNELGDMAREVAALYGGGAEI